MFKQDSYSHEKQKTITVKEDCECLNLFHFQEVLVNQDQVKLVKDTFTGQGQGHHDPPQ